MALAMVLRFRSTEAQLAGIKRSTEERRQATVERLRTAIETLKAKEHKGFQEVEQIVGTPWGSLSRRLKASDSSGVMTTDLLVSVLIGF